MNHTRAVARRESFGGVLGHRDAYGFHVINHEAFELLRRSHLEGVDLSSPDLTGPERGFFEQLRSLGMANSAGGFHGELIDNGNRVRHLSAPIRVWFEITSRCNLHCQECFNENHLDFKDDIPTEDILKILAELADSGVLQITITGGEPLLQRDVWTILEHAVSHRFGVRFFTNGTTINETNARRLSEFPISHIFASVDGIGLTNDLLRGANTFDRIARGVRFLTKHNSNVTLSTTLHALSLHNVERLFAFAAELGVRTLLIRPLLEFTKPSNSLVIRRDVISEFIDELERVSATHGIEYQLNKLPFFQREKQIYFHDRRSDVHFSYFSEYSKFGCVAGNTVAGIKSNGMVMACGFVPIQYQVNAQNSALARRFLDLWNDAENITVLRDIAPNSECGQCSLLSVCGGGCRANALLHKGSLGAVDPYCFLGDKKMLLNRMTGSDGGEAIAGRSEPAISRRTITTKCGSGSLL